MARAAKAAQPTVNLALQGGGSHGAFTWGVLDRLLEDGRLSFEGVSGASAGAMNAAVLAHGWAEDGRDGARAALERFWGAVGSNGSLFGAALLGPWADLIARTLSPYQFNPVNLNPLRSILDAHIDFERLRAASPLRLFVAATSVRTGHVRVFRSAEMSADVLLASSCLPTVFQAVEIEGEHYWDGGFLADPPLFPFFYECGTRDLLLVMVNPLARDTVPRRPGDIADRLNEITFNAALIAEMRAIAFAQKLLREDWLRPAYRGRLKDVLVHVVRADGALTELGVDSKANTAMPFLRDLHERGRQVASAWLEADLASVGVRDSIDLRRTFLTED
ncbi:patatin-like phospholipase family protein [Quisquiliibacterium transsilvanicum]|uniref:NTE family protein n=1 Tax=Quisquiliibacterium transsilvanicum TaxID=1549638 RepID=A0A7W8M9N3_9BURK|nr:patatin-like phospholipase family protein [Quisquiliibacterium transsilvanicum]MBB5272515.1 NTE family protein [Quisquiliibacterium transsilvanicum]